MPSPSPEAFRRALAPIVAPHSSPSTTPPRASTRRSTPTPSQNNAADHDSRSPPSPPSAPLSTPPLDYQDLEYVDDVDDTLVCPICHTPFHEPITTKRCGHTFCTACLKRAVELQPTCPIDRQPISFHRDQLCHPRIVSHQLDRLRVRCPNPGCNHITPRGSIAAHYDQQCDRTLVPCCDLRCGKLVERRHFADEDGCLHFETRCSYCPATIMISDMQRHFATACEGRTEQCVQCDAVEVRHRMADHVKTDCPGTSAACRYKPHGCRFSGTRRTAQQHEAKGCVYEAIGKLVRDREEDRAVISDLRGRVTHLERSQRNAMTHPHSSRSPSTTRPPSLIFDMDLSTTTNPASPVQVHDGRAWESPEDYMLSQFERIESKLEDLRKLMTELDGRHSVLLLNETMPLKDQITELRSNLGVMSMHTAWLMKLQRQSRVAAGGGGGGGNSASAGSAGGGAGDAAPGGGGGGVTASVGGGGTGGMTARIGTGRGRSDGEWEERQWAMTAGLAPRRLSGENPPRL